VAASTPLAQPRSAAIAVSSTSEPASRRRRQQQGIALAVVGLAYAAAVTALVRMPENGWVEPAFLFGALVLYFPALAWALTRKQSLERTAATPTSTSQTGVLLGYMTLFAAAVLGYGFSAVHDAISDPSLQSVAKLAVKLVTMVALPLWWFGGGSATRERVSQEASRRNLLALLVLGAAFTAFQGLVGQGLQNLSALHATTRTLSWAIPACLLWQIVEAGLCEEVLFRRVLQERLAGATGSQFAAIAWSSLLFGLAHAPGLYVRGASLLEGVGSPTPAWAAAYSIAMIAPAGVVFGVLWARTRCLWLVVILHGIVDLIPQLAGFVQNWQHAA
jgi:membrane protease YdiL (CAAX protease family)